MTTTATTEQLATAYARELDPAPITDEMLVAEGWVLVSDGYFVWPDSDIDVMDYTSVDKGVWVIDYKSSEIEVTTIGQLRTALRLAKGE